MPRPRKVNTHLKKLAESRARATATIERLNDNLENLRPKIEEAKEALLHLEELKFNIEHRLNLYHNEIRATDKTIREQFPGVEPTEIPTTYGFRSEYGRRGALRDTIREVLREAGDEGMTLKNLGLSERLARLIGYHQALLRPKSGKIHGEFLCHLLRHTEVNNHFAKLATGSTRFGLSLESIHKLPLFFYLHSKSKNVLLKSCLRWMSRLNLFVLEFRSIKKLKLDLQKLLLMSPLCLSVILC